LTDLLDVNLLVSLAWPNHVHHRQALRWFVERAHEPWATTPVTESGFIRVSSNRSAVPTAVTPAEALALLARVRAQPGHRFLSDDVELVIGAHGDQAKVKPMLVATHNLVTDAHLLALARRHAARLATLDKGIMTLAGDKPQDVLIVPT
jgi:toxin-antitoxin system PIN domain toxin